MLKQYKRPIEQGIVPLEACIIVLLPGMLQKDVGYICSPSHTSKTLVGMGIVEL